MSRKNTSREAVSEKRPRSHPGGALRNDARAAIATAMTTPIQQIAATPCTRSMAVPQALPVPAAAWLVIANEPTVSKEPTKTPRAPLRGASNSIVAVTAMSMAAPRRVSQYPPMRVENTRSRSGNTANSCWITRRFNIAPTSSMAAPASAAVPSSLRVVSGISGQSKVRSAAPAAIANPMRASNRTVTPSARGGGSRSLPSAATLFVDSGAVPSGFSTVNGNEPRSPCPSTVDTLNHWTL